MLFAIVSFLFHPIRFVKDWRESRRYFDRNGYRKAVDKDP